MIIKLYEFGGINMAVRMEFKGITTIGGHAICMVFIGDFELDTIAGENMEEAIGKAVVKYLGLVNDDGIVPVFYIED